MDEKIWIYPEKKDIPPELIKIAGSVLFAKLLVNRGIDTVQKAETFLYPEKLELSSPYLFNDMEKAVARINKAIEKEEHIVIYGDFDCDGVTSTSLLLKTMRHLGADVSYYIPDRTEEGHGMNNGALCQLISQRKVKLIITCDNGIGSVAEVKLAQSLGTDVIITDHHEAPEIMPDAYAILNPKAPGSLVDDTPDILTYLAGVGMAYKLAEALLDFHEKADFKDDILPLVAIGSIADCVPLIKENRTLVKKGLERISPKKHLGITKLLVAAGCKLENQVTSDMIGFWVAPRINAIGRLAHASVAVELLTSEKADMVDSAVQKLNQANLERQQLTEEMFQEAVFKVEQELDLNKNKAIILYEKDWHPGLVGIVASKLVEKYYCPAFLISVDEEKNIARCSVRSIVGLNVYEVLDSMKEFFTNFGGHSLAAGFGVDLSVNKLEAVVEKLNEVINSTIEEESLQPRLSIDFDLQAEDLTTDFIQSISRLEPFGEMNPTPVFSMKNLSLQQYKTIGSANNHLKMVVAAEEKNKVFDALWWNNTEIDAQIHDKMSLAFFPQINEFNGRNSVQFILRDMKINSDNKDVISIKELKWVDHRNKTNFGKALLNFIKTSDDTFQIFAENLATIQKLKSNKLFEQITKSRLNIDKAKHLLLFDFPADSDIFRNIIEKTDADMIHFIGLNSVTKDSSSEIEVIKKISGMLKYAFANKSGDVNYEELASATALNLSCVKSCVSLLNKANVIKIKEEKKDCLSFEFIEAVEMAILRGLEEYKTFENELQQIKKYRQRLNSDDILNIKNLISN